RVGGTKTIACDVRIIAATNRDLHRAIEEEKFREDLFYRLNVFPIELPSLRMRREDIPLLIEYFTANIAKELGMATPRVAPEVVEQLCAYDWPGNIREMRNVIERAVLLSESGVLKTAQLPREIVEKSPDLTGAAARGESSLVSYEKAMILKAMKEAHWNQ